MLVYQRVHPGYYFTLRLWPQDATRSAFASSVAGDIGPNEANNQKLAASQQDKGRNLFFRGGATCPNLCSNI